MTTPGTVIASIAAGVATDAAGNGNVGSTSTDNTVTWDTAAAGRATTISLFSSRNPSSFNQSMTFLAIVRPASGFGFPTGTVTFRDGRTVLATRSLFLGLATYTTSSLALGSHSITATYNPTGTWLTSSRSLTQVVNSRSTSTSLSSSRNPSNFGQWVTFTATVTSSFGTPTGTVTFQDGATELATVPLNASGRATFATSSLSRGNHTISATYTPSVPTFLASSQSLFQRVR